MDVPRRISTFWLLHNDWIAYYRRGNGCSEEMAEQAMCFICFCTLYFSMLPEDCASVFVVLQALAQVKEDRLTGCKVKGTQVYYAYRIFTDVL
jgi:hypothetical protein